ncbi:MAG TPA: TIGR00269 family protein, partial [Nitrososphaera sp.]|nr:TIGR00269 family protein [Nitrososphaera sp.]
EYEIAFYALQREIPFQSEECPYMNESIRSDLRSFFNALEKSHPGMKYNAYNTMLKVSKVMRDTGSQTNRKKCAHCGRISTGDICSVCGLVGVLASNKQI